MTGADTLIRVYKGRQQADAIAAFQVEARQRSRDAADHDQRQRGGTT